MSATLIGYLLSLAAMLLFTSAIVLTRVAAPHIDVGNGFLVATTVNVIFASIVFLIDLSVRPEGLQWSWHAFWMYAIGGVFSTYLGRWFFYESVLKFGPARASVFQISSPLFTALIAWLVLSESLTLVTVIGMFLAIGGLIMVSSAPRAAVKVSVESRKTVDAIVKRTIGQRAAESLLLIGLASALAYAVGNVFKGMAVRSWNEPILGAAIGALFGLALHFLAAPRKHELWGRLRGVSKKGLYIYMIIGVAGISAQICAMGSMRNISLGVSTLITLCTPLAVIPISHFLFKDDRALSPRMLIGSAITIFGIYLVVMR